MGAQIGKAFLRVVGLGAACILAGWALSSTRAFQAVVPFLIGIVALKALPVLGRVTGPAPAYARDPVTGERVLVGIHEAGHAYAARDAGIWAKARVLSDQSGYTKAGSGAALAHAVIALAGGHAERKAGGAGGDGSDRRAARRLWRMSGADISFGEVDAMARRAVASNWSAIVRDGTRLAEGGWLKL